MSCHVIRFKIIFWWGKSSRIPYHHHRPPPTLAEKRENFTHMPVVIELFSVEIVALM